MFLQPPPGHPPALIDWEYNAWGGKYPPFDFDNAVPGHVAKVLGMKRYSPGIILEGGSVDGNGAGTILTTTSCLLNPNRNADLPQREVEQYLADYCGAKKVLWLEGHFAGDDTDGHIDQLARFVGPRTVVTIREDDPSDENHEPLADNIRRLESMTDQDGHPLEVVSIPLPAPKFQDEQRLPAGYCNFYIANGLVLVPTFRDPADQVAIDTLARLMPDRQVVGLDSLDLIWGLGSFHCLSQQQPRV
jgi:agmatine deiminase